MIVLADLRWPPLTGIGRMAGLYASLRPESAELRPVETTSRIGSPWSPFALSMAVRRQQPGDVFWNPGFIPVLGAPCPSAVTVHDLTHLHHYTRAHRTYYQTVLRPLYRRTEAIVCVSQYTRAEFIDWAGVDPARVSVVYNALSPGFADLAEAPTAGQPYIFYAGNHRPYKNLATLIVAFAHSGLPARGVELRLTGARNAELDTVARRQKVEESVRFLGQLDDPALVRCYKGASAVAFLSRYEGFGLPLLEAMACSAPLLAADASCLPEIAGDAALLVDPDDVNAIAASLVRLFDEPALADELRRRGQRRLAAFEASASAARLWDILGQLGAGGAA